jgi:hypothetical protein
MAKNLCKNDRSDTEKKPSELQQKANGACDTQQQHHSIAEKNTVWGCHRSHMRMLLAYQLPSWLLLLVQLLLLAGKLSCTC